jgi:hypothetical protein
VTSGSAAKGFYEHHYLCQQDFSDSGRRLHDNAGSATAYFLLVRSSLNGSDIYSSGMVTVLSKIVNNIPTDGRTIYVTLGSQVNGSWTYKNYTYKAFKVR